MPYRIELRDFTEVILNRLVDLGALDVEQPQGGGLTALMPDSVNPTEIGDVLGTDTFLVSPAIGRDAESVWVLSPTLVRIGRLEIAPADMPAAPCRVRLLDEPVFGSGLHPTTALCLAALQDIVEADAPNSVLDVGTGSGVLALAALALGVPHALAIDVDDEALRVAAENAHINAVGERLQLQRGGPESVTRRWPLVMANILAAVLIDMAPMLARRVAHRGRLVLSGVPSSVAEDVRRTYRELGMRPLLTTSRGDWVAIILQATW